MLTVKGNRILLPDKKVFSGYLHIQDGKIAQILESLDVENECSSAEFIDAGDYVVMPGVVDSHVHINEPGRTQWEGFTTATRAAAAGGITTVVDMPLNCIPSTTTLDAFRTKLQAAEGQCWVDMAFWGGIVPGNQDEIQPMVKAGVRGFKSFLIFSGVEEFPHVQEEDVRAAMEKLKGTNAVYLFHAEVESDDPGKDSKDGYKDPMKYQTFLESRPEQMENEAIELVIKLCDEYKVPCHIVHLSSASALPVIHKARSEGVPLSIETTHHYLSLTAEDVPDGATQFKCCPPVRGKKNQDALWEAIRDGDIDLVVSDHSPCTPDLKLMGEGDFMQAWGGISSLQFGLSLFWTGAKRHGLTLHDLMRVLCEEPAKLCHLDHRKGSIEVGKDADLVIWDPERAVQIDRDMILHRNKVSPYEGKICYGEVLTTILRGQVIFDKRQLTSQPMGTFLLDPAYPPFSCKI